MTIKTAPKASDALPSSAATPPEQSAQRSISEIPFGTAHSDLLSARERAPLVHVFGLALSEEILRRSRWRTWLGLEQASHAAECGVYQGHSMAACMNLANQQGLPMSITGLDTFKGLPPLGQTDFQLAPAGISYTKRTLFTNTSREAVEATLQEQRGSCRFDLVEGLFSDTLSTLEPRTYFFVNIDCDLYEPHLECMRYFYPRLRPGGIMFFDDYHSINYPMGKKAVDDFLADKPEALWHVRLGEDGENVTKSFIRKA